MGMAGSRNVVLQKDPMFHMFFVASGKTHGNPSPPWDLSVSMLPLAKPQKTSLSRCPAPQTEGLSRRFVEPHGKIYWPTSAIIAHRLDVQLG